MNLKASIDISTKTEDFPAILKKLKVSETSVAHVIYISNSILKSWHYQARKEDNFSYCDALDSALPIGICPVKQSKRLSECLCQEASRIGCKYSKPNGRKKKQFLDGKKWFVIYKSESMSFAEVVTDVDKTETKIKQLMEQIKQVTRGA